ncbi:MAG: FAD-dependent oxidoreductase, partial [Cyanobacteria bacterium J06648_11]
CILNGLGTQVTQVIRGDRILRRFDDDVRTELQIAMQHNGIRILADTTEIAIESSDEKLQINLTGNAYKETIATDTVALAATGRKPNLNNLGLSNTSVAVERGSIVVNEWNQTSVESIFAVGDCCNRLNLTPVAVEEGRAFADTQFGDRPWHANYDTVPTAVFSTPEVATVGLTEAAARDRLGDRIKVYRSRFTSTYHSLCNSEGKVLMKLIVDGESDRVVGAHMVGEHAAEIVQSLAVAINMGATKADFDATTALHPSAAEEFVTMR